MLYLALAVLCVLLTAISFGNTLGVYFHCDDFLHLPYLYRVFHGEPQLLLANFTGPWINERSLYLFYRPITELCLAVDYALWNVNPWGYHLSNLILHALNGFLVGILYLKILQRLKLPAGTAIILPAALFISFPTHSEAVAWILARSDLLGLTFYLACLIAFVGAHKNWSLVCFILALGSKEMAASIPAVLLLWTYLSSEETVRIKRFKQAWKETIPFILIAVLYILIRSLALGTVTGGYVGSIGESLNSSLLDRWLLSGSLWQLMHPFNEAFFADDHPLRLILRIFYGLCGVLIITGLGRKEQANRQKLLFFAAGFLILTLLPSLQVWGMSSLMAGGRIAYLPCVPLAMLICTGLNGFEVFKSKDSAPFWPKARALLAVLTAVGLTLTYSTISRENNQAWLNSSRLIKSMAAQIANLADHLPDGKKLALVNLPCAYNGAYTFTTRSMLAGLMCPPLADKDRRAKVIAIDFRPYWSSFVNFNDFEQAKSDELHWFAPKDETIKPVMTSAPISSYREELSVRQDLQDKGLYVYLKPGRKIDTASAQFLEIELKARHKPLSQTKEIDFYDIEQSIKGKAERAPIFLTWNNRPSQKDDLTKAHWTNIQADDQMHKVVVELGSLSTWLLSNNVNELRLDLNSTLYDWQVGRAALVGPQGTMPDLKLKGVSYALTPLVADRLPPPAVPPHFNFQGLDQADSTIIEVSKPLCAFEHYELKMRGKLASANELRLSRKVPAAQGTFSLRLAPARAGDLLGDIYQVRIGSLDSAGKLIGTMSDAVTLRSNAPVEIEMNADAATK